MKQAIIRFKFKKINKESVCISEKNFFAYKIINEWPKWSNNVLFIYGPKNCGKTLFSNIWRVRSNASMITSNFFLKDDFKANISKIDSESCWIIEDLDVLLKKKANDIEEKFLNFFNIIISKGNYMLITSKKNPSNLKNKLSDLTSRLNACIVIEVKEPDQNLLGQIILKKLNSKQINVSEKSIKYLINRVERSYNSAKKIANLIDKKSLELKLSPSISFMKKLIDENNL
tara:strand:+ start:1380 stop:2069 length:690 start_codon:yes stop_codon:yes gene_type:complete